jgi:pimeloyl-ACP methyl ester carboxylesterase
MLVVRDAGDPAGMPVLVHMGTPCASLLYERHIRDAEARGIRLFSYDRPGYGGSIRKPGRSVVDGAADAETVCDALGIDRFCVWGIGGGGPYALATAALLPERVVAAAALGSRAPWDADGLDPFAGMGEENVDYYSAILAGEVAHLAALERDRTALLNASPEGLVAVWRTLFPPADVEVLTPRLAGYLLDCMREGIEASPDGYFDDDVAVVGPWGFSPESIRVPLQLWYGEQDKFVPYAQGAWLAEHISEADTHFLPDDGHITLLERRVPEVHAWFVNQLGRPAGSADRVRSPVDHRRHETVAGSAGETKAARQPRR